MKDQNVSINKYSVKKDSQVWVWIAAALLLAGMTLAGHFAQEEEAVYQTTREVRR